MGVGVRVGFGVRVGVRVVVGVGVMGGGGVRVRVGVRAGSKHRHAVARTHRSPHTPQTLSLSTNQK